MGRRRGRWARFAGAIALAITAGALGGCYTTAGYDQRVAAFVGETPEKLRREWGKPWQTTYLADGSKFIDYRATMSIPKGETTYETVGFSVRNKETKKPETKYVKIPNSLKHQLKFGHA